MKEQVAKVLTEIPLETLLEALTNAFLWGLGILGTFISTLFTIIYFLIKRLWDNKQEKDKARAVFIENTVHKLTTKIGSLLSMISGIENRLQEKLTLTETTMLKKLEKVVTKVEPQLTNLENLARDLEVNTEARSNMLKVNSEALNFKLDLVTETYKQNHGKVIELDKQVKKTQEHIAVMAVILDENGLKRKPK